MLLCVSLWLLGQAGDGGVRLDAVKPQLSALRCPKGARAVTDGEALFCTNVGGKALTGPYVGLHPDGTKESEGRYENGERVGTWTFFDPAGRRVRQIEFKGDRYDGLYVEFHADGKTPKVEVPYRKGQRQGTLRELDEQGRVTGEVKFVNDRPAK